MSTGEPAKSGRLGARVRRRRATGTRRGAVTVEIVGSGEAAGTDGQCLGADPPPLMAAGCVFVAGGVSGAWCWGKERSDS